MDTQSKSSHGCLIDARKAKSARQTSATIAVAAHVFAARAVGRDRDSVGMSVVAAAPARAARPDPTGVDGPLAPFPPLGFCNAQHYPTNFKITYRSARCP